MSDFTTTHGHELLILTNDADIVLGTAQLGDQFGVIKRAIIRRTGDRELIQHGKTKKLLMVLIHNPGFEMVLECAFSKNVTPPGMGESLSLPLVGVKGFVMEGVTVQWESGSERGLSIPVSSWDTMQSAAAFRLTVGGEKILLGEAGVTAPGTAPGLAGTATSSAVGLSWNSIARAALYLVQYSTNGGSTWTTLIDTPNLSTTHSGLAPESELVYRVRGHNSAGDGPWSDELEIETSGVAPSAAPSLSGSALSNAYSTQLNWSVNVAYADDYELQFSTDGGSSWGLLSTQTTGSFAHAVNAAGASRKYRVRARNSVGDGPWSNVVTLTTPTLGTLSLTASVLVDGVYLQWNTPAIASQYELQGSDDAETWSTLHIGAENSHTDNFVSGTRYYRVRASSSLETGPWSATVSGTVGIAAPVLSMVSLTREGKVQTSFSPVPGAATHAVQFCQLSDFSTGIVTVSGLSNPTLITASTLDSTLGSGAGNRLIYARGRVATPVVGPWSDVVSALSPPARPGFGSWDSYTVSWSAVDGADRYLIEIGGVLAEEVTSPTVNLSEWEPEISASLPVVVYARRDVDGMESLGRDLGHPS